MSSAETRTLCIIRAMNNSIIKPKKPVWASIAEQLMAKRGLYQKDLIDVFKVKTRGAVGHYLSGRREPTIEQLIALAELLGVSVSELVGEIPLTGNSQDTQEILTLLRGIPPERFAAMIPLLRSLSEQPVPAASGAEEAS